MRKKNSSKKRGEARSPRSVTSNEPSTEPKPFVFVLMPFDKQFADVYEFGIRNVARKLGAYAERLDEQNYEEGMLDRIFNQISKADVIVADMSGRNPNVFYEVGYAHALGKVVVLLTRKAEDIPFDLKHRHHIVYDGSAKDLTAKLTPRLRWALNESITKKGRALVSRISAWVGHTLLPTSFDANMFEFTGSFYAGSTDISIQLLLRNESEQSLTDVTHMYLFLADSPGIAPSEPHYYETDDDLLGSLDVFARSNRKRSSWSSYQSEIDGFVAVEEDARHGLVRQFRLPNAIAAIPPHAAELLRISFKLNRDHVGYHGPARLRIHTSAGAVDFYFRINVKYFKESPAMSPEQQSTQQAAPPDDDVKG
jgi:nucleoside 2-deoxyribosyltransferase